MKPSRNTKPVGIFNHADIACLLAACLFAGMTLGLLFAPIINA